MNEHSIERVRFFDIFLAGSSLRRHPQHAHFVGTVQVMKAVGTHLVLTFCEQNNEIFTIILFREKNVKAQEVSLKVENFNFFL